LQGGSATLIWSSTNTTSCTSSNFTASGIIGSVSVTPQTTTQYSITCTGAGGTATGAATITVTTPPTTSDLLKAGDRIVTTERLNVRATACNSGKPGKQSIGKYGTILIPSTPGCGYTWARVNFDTGADGWVVQDYLQKVTSASTETDLSAALMPSIQSASSAAALMQLEQQLQALLAQVQTLMARIAQ
jgi:hypothetical protein